jgi:DNA-binding CsgD family transcriptional regulator
MSLDLSFVDAIALVVMAAGALILGRALAPPASFALTGLGVVVLVVMFGSVAGIVLAVAVLGLSVTAGALIRQTTATDAPTPGGAPASSPSPTAAWTNPDELTAREVEVLELIAAGRSNQEIADTLHISMATVKTHVNRVFAKTGVRDRAQAVVYAYDRGLTTSPPQG